MNKKTPQISRLLIQLALVFTLLISFTSTALAVDTPPSGTGAADGSTLGGAKGLSNAIRQIGSQKDTSGQKYVNLPTFDAGHADQNYHAGASQLTSVIYFALDFLKYILGSIAVLMMVISGIKLVIAARGVAETMNREKETLRYASSGLMIILIADQFIKNVFFGQEGEVYRTATDMQMAAEKSNQLAAGIGNLLKIFIPSVAVLFFIIAGVRMILSQGNQEAMNKAKTQMTWSVAGLVVAGLAELVVTTIIYPNNGQQLSDTHIFALLMIRITNFVTGFMSTIAVSMIIYAGYIYVVSMGGDGVAKAKKIVTGAVIGLLIAMAAFALVNTFVKI
jgi:hypothetical protein